MPFPSCQQTTVTHVSHSFVGVASSVDFDHTDVFMASTHTQDYFESHNMDEEESSGDEGAGDEIEEHIWVSTSDGMLTPLCGHSRCAFIAKAAITAISELEDTQAQVTGESIW